MSSENSSGASSALSLATLLTVAFVVLKLCNIIDWSWWWVLSPILIQSSIVILALTIWFVVKCIQEYRYLKRKEKRNE